MHVQHIPMYQKLDCLGLEQGSRDMKNWIKEDLRRKEMVFVPIQKADHWSLIVVNPKTKLIEYTLANGYIDTSIQKGGVPAVSGCMEHTAILSQLIREAKAEKKGLVVVWLDIANAYGSIPHNLIQIALRRAHAPEGFYKLVESY